MPKAILNMLQLFHMSHTPNLLKAPTERSHYLAPPALQTPIKRAMTHMRLITRMLSSVSEVIKVSHLTHTNDAVPRTHLLQYAEFDEAIARLHQINITRTHPPPANQLPPHFLQAGVAANPLQLQPTIAPLPPGLPDLSYYVVLGRMPNPPPGMYGLGHGKASVSLYSRNEDYDCHFCFTTFFTPLYCPHRTLCRYRHHWLFRTEEAAFQKHWPEAYEQMKTCYSLSAPPASPNTMVFPKPFRLR